MLLIDKTFKESFERVSDNVIDGMDVLDYFYKIFFETSEDISRLFKNTSMDAQKRLLKKSIQELVNFYNDKRVNEHLVQIGQIHGANMLNISPAMYKTWLDTLMLTVKKFDPEYSLNVELSWRATLAPGITYMIFAYEHPDLLTSGDL